MPHEYPDRSARAHDAGPAGVVAPSVHKFELDELAIEVEVYEVPVDDWSPDERSRFSCSTYSLGDGRLRVVRLWY